MFRCLSRFFFIAPVAVASALVPMLTSYQALAQTPGGGSSSALLEEIIVTARKREESLQDAPIAVSAFSGEALDFRGVTDLEKLDQFTPNLVLNESPTNSNVTNAAVFIRGIGQTDFVPVIDPGVGIYVDGVYLGRSVGAVLDIVDLERIEVLRGPQGTLFGRNTIGGAISMTSKRPDEEFGGKVDVKVGTDEMVKARGSVNVPLADNLFGRFSLATFQQDGYVKRVFDGKKLGDQDVFAARGSVRWQPADNLDITLSGDYSRERENGSPGLTTGIQPVNVGIATGGGPSMTLAANTIAAQLANGGPPSFVGGAFFDVTQPFPFQFLACEQPANFNNPFCFNSRYIDDGGKKYNHSTDPSKQELDVWGFSGVVEWDITDKLAVKSITALRGFDGYFAGDQDGSPVRVSYLIDIYEHEQISQEVQLLGSSFQDRLDWIAGFYYFDEEGENLNPVRFSQVYLQSGGEYEADSWAVFGQGTWHVTDRLDLTVGLRYTEDQRDYLPVQFIEVLPIGPLPVFCPPGQMQRVCQVGDRPLPYETVSHSTEELVPMANLAYQWNDQLMTYFTYSEGFKSGGFTQRIFPPEPSTPSFNPEFVTSYEVGLKFEGWDNRLRLNLAGFFTDYEDLQLLVADPTRVGPFVSNAGDAEIWGMEAEWFANPAEGWFITGSVGLTDADRTRLGGGVQGLTLDSRFEHISKWMANAQIYKEFSIGEWGYLTPRVEWSYRSKYGTNSNNVPRDGAPTLTSGPFANAPLSFGVANPALIEDDLHLVNISLRWDVRNTNLAVTAGADNLADKEYRIFGNQQDAFGFTQEAFHRGREWYLHGIFEF